MAHRLQDAAPFAGHARQDRPLGAYAALDVLYVAATLAFAAWFRGSGRPLPDRMEERDLVLVALATHKLTRIVAKDRVTSSIRAPFTRFQGDAGAGEVDEAARGRGLRRALGELLVCPYCLAPWFAAAFAAGLLVAPRATRWLAGILTAVFAADMLQLAYLKAERAV
jgi:hypothetical protein